MSRRIFTYFLSIFFILLLFAKDVVIVFPSLILSDTAIEMVQVDWTEEESERSRGTEEVVRTNFSEYIDGEHTFALTLPVFLLSEDKNLPVNSYFKQTFYGSIVTPPPDRA